MTRLAQLLGDGRLPRAAGALAGVAMAALSTALLYPLREIAPAVSLGVVYLLGVLVVSAGWGAAVGIATALLSALAFNFFHIPPTGRLSISEAENWVALVTFLVAAVLASALGTTARNRTREAEERRREAQLSAELATLLLRGDGLAEALGVASQRLAQALDVSSAVIDLRAVEAEERRVVFALRDRTRQIGTLLLPAETSEVVLRRVQERIVPALEALLAPALERDELLGEIVQTEALQRSDVIKTALLRTVSHDLRSPITAILTSAEAVAAPTIADDDRVELAEGIGDEAGRLAHMVDDLLDLSRLEADAAQPRPEWCSIDEVIREAARSADGGPEAFTLSLADDLPLVRADAAQLERAIANILENAARYSGGHPVSVRARSVRHRIIVRVVDRGPGIPSAQLERIFQPFYRAGTQDTEHRGSGLGLAIARGFVEANGGKLWAESLPGQGTTFVMELPLDATETTA